MKKMLTTCILTISSTFLLVGCSCDKSCDKPKDITIKTTKIKPKEAIKVAIQRTDSGLGYEVITAGSGATPEVGQTITVHYTGWLDDKGMPGAKFDSSVDRGTPFSTAIGVGRVIGGWEEGMQLMQVGEKRRLYIPSDLGYGSRGAGASIPPNADLIFDVELLKIS
jgi:peptidylprolyl isomerase